MKKKKNKEILEIVKAARKQSREEEILLHGKPLNYSNVIASKKLYNRRKEKEKY